MHARVFAKEVVIADIWQPGHMATPQGRGVVVPGQGMGVGSLPFAPLPP